MGEKGNSAFAHIVNIQHPAHSSSLPIALLRSMLAPYPRLHDYACMHACLHADTNVHIQA